MPVMKEMTSEPTTAACSLAVSKTKSGVATASPSASTLGNTAGSSALETKARALATVVMSPPEADGDGDRGSSGEGWCVSFRDRPRVSIKVELAPSNIEPGRVSSERSRLCRELICAQRKHTRR